MEIIVEGVRIQLTKSQLKTIEKARREREKCYNNFKDTLLHFGFKAALKCNNSYEHVARNWYAEINDDQVWLVGTGLKCGGFPGGWIYNSPEELSQELIKAQ